MMDFGWKKKAEHLRVALLSVGHQPAKPLPPGITKLLELFRRTAETGDGSTLQAELSQIPPDTQTPLWEPAQIHGWEIQATMYLQDNELWWLVQASRKSTQEPSEKDVTFLENVLDHLGAQPSGHVIIGPRSSPPGHPRLMFGWWTWRNHAPLLEVQVHKHKTGPSMMRIVPLGTRPSDGYESIDLRREAAEDKQ